MMSITCGNIKWDDKDKIVDLSVDMFLLFVLQNVIFDITKEM